MADVVEQPKTPLDYNTPLVNAEGKPTLQFIKIWQQNNENSTVNSEGLAGKVDKTTQVLAGTGLTGGGSLDADVVVTHGTFGPTPGSYTNADITVDALGHVTAAANGTGGGSGGPFGEFAYKPPLATDFPITVTAGAATLTKTDVAGKGLSLAMRINGANRAAAACITPPSLPFTATMRLSAFPSSITTTTPNIQVGFMLRNSSNGRCLMFYRLLDGNNYFQRWSDLNTFNANLQSSTLPRAGEGGVYLAINVSGANVVTPYSSADGVNWTAHATETLGAYLTAAGGAFDQIGIWLACETTFTGTNALISYWRVDAVSPPAVALA